MLEYHQTKKQKVMIEREKRASKMFSKCIVYCKCGHSVVIKPIVDRILCSYCGYWIYRTPEIEKKYKQQDFERKLKKYLKESNENDNQARGRKLGTKRNRKTTKKV